MQKSIVSKDSVIKKLADKQDLKEQIEKAKTINDLKEIILKIVCPKNRQKIKN
jgi:glutamate synthase domain-containing protein 2